MSHLKPYYGNPPLIHDPVIVDGEFEVQQILNHCTLDYRTKYLVRWLGYNADSDKRIPEQSLEHAQRILKEYKK